ncbi:MAG: PIN domain-containing protein [Anaerolineae bacterium]|nr:PIN domain-containing protein [Anaerolineae bacterium]
MKALIDSTVVVDIIRNHPPAIAWVKAQSEPPGITVLVWMEAVAGAQNKIAQIDTINVISGFPLVYPTPTDMDWAMRQLFDYKLSHGVGLVDCLIASVCHRLQLPLYTHNRKHIEPILGAALTVKPY